MVLRHRPRTVVMTQRPAPMARRIAMRRGHPHCQTCHLLAARLHQQAAQQACLRCLQASHPACLLGQVCLLFLQAPHQTCNLEPALGLLHSCFQVYHRVWHLLPHSLHCHQGHHRAWSLGRRCRLAFLRAFRWACSWVLARFQQEWAVAHHCRQDFLLVLRHLALASRQQLQWRRPFPLLCHLLVCQSSWRGLRSLSRFHRRTSLLSFRALAS